MQDTITRAIPITDLRKTSEISALCHAVNAPVLITKNGYSDLVIMTVEAFERHMQKSEIAAKLAVAEAELRSGVEGAPLKDVIAKQREKINGK